jgi:hypothetical protein
MFGAAYTAAAEAAARRRPFILADSASGSGVGGKGERRKFRVTDRAVGRELTQWMKLFENLGDNFFRDSRCVGKDMCAQLRSDHAKSSQRRSFAEEAGRTSTNPFSACRMPRAFTSAERRPRQHKSSLNIVPT